MSRGYQQLDPFAPPRDMFVVDAALSERLGFLRKVYAHVFGSILLLVGLEYLYFTTGIANSMLAMMGQSFWIMLLLAMGVMMLAQRMAYSGASLVTQYTGLGLFVGVESILMAPVLAYAMVINADLIGQAAFITLAITGALTLVVVVSKVDFSFMRYALILAGIGMFCLGLGSMIFGFTLGLGFSVGIVVLMCGYILYETSLIMHHLPLTAHVTGALMIFSSIAVLFRQILMILIHLNDD